MSQGGSYERARVSAGVRRGHCESSSESGRRMSMVVSEDEIRHLVLNSNTVLESVEGPQWCACHWEEAVVLPSSDEGLQTASSPGSQRGTSEGVH